MNRYVLSTIFALTVFSLYGMEENSGGSAGNGQRIFSVDALLETERSKMNKSSRIESWRQVTPEDLEQIAQELDLPDKAVRDASLYYKKMTRSFDTFRNASRERILSEAEMHRRDRTITANIGKEIRNALNAITPADERRKAKEVGVSLQTVHKAVLHYRRNKRKPEFFQQASGQELKEAAACYERSLQEQMQHSRDKRSAAKGLLELQTSGEQP